jgi:hypothetical protein
VGVIDWEHMGLELYPTVKLGKMDSEEIEMIQDLGKIG